MDEHIQRLKEVRAIILVIPDTPIKNVPDRIYNAVELMDALIAEAKDAHQQHLLEDDYET